MKEGRERETFQSQRVHLREEGTTENTRERERALFSGLQFVSPLGEPMQSFTFGVQNARGARKK